jgi:hypothetical protein
MTTEFLIGAAALMLSADVLIILSGLLSKWFNPQDLLSFLKGPWFKVSWLGVFVCIWMVARLTVLKNPLFLGILLFLTAALSLGMYLHAKKSETKLRQSLNNTIEQAESALSKLSSGPVLMDPRLDEQLLRARINLIEAKSQMQGEPYDPALAMKKAKVESLCWGGGWVVVQALKDTWSFHHPDIFKDLFVGCFVGLTMLGMASVKIRWKKRAVSQANVVSVAPLAEQ